MAISAPTIVPVGESDGAFKQSNEHIHTRSSRLAHSCTFCRERIGLRIKLPRVHQTGRRAAQPTTTGMNGKATSEGDVRDGGNVGRAACIPRALCPITAHHLETGTTSTPRLAALRLRTGSITVRGFEAVFLFWVLSGSRATAPRVVCHSHEQE